MGALVGDVLEEEAGVEPLAAQPAVVVGEAGDDGVDLARVDEPGEVVEGQHPAGDHRGDARCRWSRAGRGRRERRRGC